VGLFLQRMQEGECPTNVDWGPHTRGAFFSHYTRAVSPEERIQAAGLIHGWGAAGVPGGARLAKLLLTGQAPR